MKKYFFLILALIMLSFATKVYSTCPDGYTTTVINIPNIGGCAYNVTICYKCIVPGYPLLVSVDEFTKVDPNCPQSLTTSQVFNQIYIWIQSNFYNLNLCNPEWPPCDGINYYHVLLMYSKCWMKTTGHDNITHYTRCEGCNCCVPVKYCWNERLQQLIELPDGEPYWDCTTDCTAIEPPGGNTTSCFYLSTPCD